MKSPEDEYDQFANDMDAQIDKLALNATMAWLAVDPNRNIQRDREERERKSAENVNRIGAQSTHQVREDIELQRVEEIFDLKEREKARNYYLARKRVHEKRKLEGC
jgi:hypothetical protein